MTATADYYDVFCRRRRDNAETYIRDATMLMGDGTRVTFTDGRALKIPAVYALELAAKRRDMFALPSPDQTPPVPVLLDATAIPAEEEFEPLPPEAVTGAPAADAGPGVGDWDPEAGHRVPPGRPTVSDEEKARRVAEAKAHLESLPAAERPAAAGTEPVVEKISDAVEGQAHGTLPEGLQGQGLTAEQIAKLPPDARVAPVPEPEPLLTEDEQRARDVEAALAAEKAANVQQDAELRAGVQAALETLEKAELLAIAERLQVPEVTSRWGEKRIITAILDSAGARRVLDETVAGAIFHNAGDGGEGADGDAQSTPPGE